MLQAAKDEQRIDMAWALEALLARVERALIVEIRLPLPPPDVTDGDKTVSTPDKYEKLRELNNKINFPAVEGTPILILPQITTDIEPPVPRVRRRQQEPEA